MIATTKLNARPVIIAGLPGDHLTQSLIGPLDRCEHVTSDSELSQGSKALW